MLLDLLPFLEAVVRTQVRWGGICNGGGGGSGARLGRQHTAGRGHGYALCSSRAVSWDRWL